MLHVMSDFVGTVKCQSLLVQSGVLAIPKISAGITMFLLPEVQGKYNITQYLARLGIFEIKTVQNILRGFL